MSEKKPQPLLKGSGDRRCPVCGQNSYSKSGIHPQCSVELADEKQKELLKEAKRLADSEREQSPPKKLSRWQKSCPRCQARVHVRLKVCSCGHRFAASTSPASEM